MWQKTYRIDLGTAVTPRQVIATWKAHFPEFWPQGNRFAGALAGISPGDVALLDLAVGGGVKLSTGVFVLYADEESFTLMTPQGHMFAGWITFSAQQSGTGDVRPGAGADAGDDPLYEIGLTLGGHRKEDLFWAQALTALGERLGVADPRVETRSECIDPRRQWRNAGNVWHNAAVRSVLQALATPFGKHDRRQAAGA